MKARLSLRPTRPLSSNRPLRILNRRRGSIALEAAIAFPLIIALAWMLIAQIRVEKRRIQIEAALERTAGELSLISSLGALLSDLPADSADSLTFPQPIRELVGEWFAGQSIRGLFARIGFDLGSTALAGPVILDRVRFWQRELLVAGGGDSAFVERCLDEARLHLTWRPECRQLWLNLQVPLRTLAGTRVLRLHRVVPLWGFPDPPDISEPAQQETDDIWSLDNFTRGRQFRSRYGANLPDDYPVIASYQDGSATSMKSVDYTAPTYRDPSQFTRRIQSEIKELAGFDGARYDKGGRQIDIQPERITSRRLVLILPENDEPGWLDSAISDAVRGAADAGVRLEVVRSGISARYQQNKNRQ